MRIDAYLAQSGLCKSRERARLLILKGCVKIDGIAVSKPSFSVEGTEKIIVNDIYDRYVGRGGFKLEKALAHFNVCADGAIVLDIGASTGGFTDCWLQHGAAKVYASDVGNGQLAPSLLADPRVICLENTDARTLTREQIGDITKISADVSFISLGKILPVIRRFLPENGTALTLIKPQFEAGREHLSSNGVVKSTAVHAKVLRNMLEQAQSLSFFIEGLTFSPLKGGDGNIEYWMCLSGKTHQSKTPDVDATVKEAFEYFKKEARL